MGGALKIARCQRHLTLWQNLCIVRVKARIDQLDIERGRIGLRGIVKGGLPWGPTGRRDRHGLTLCYGSDRVKVRAVVIVFERSGAIIVVDDHSVIERVCKFCLRVRV